MLKALWSTTSFGSFSAHSNGIFSVTIYNKTDRVRTDNDDTSDDQKHLLMNGNEIS